MDPAAVGPVPVPERFDEVPAAFKEAEPAVAAVLLVLPPLPPPPPPPPPGGRPEEEAFCRIREYWYESETMSEMNFSAEMERRRVLVGWREGRRVEFR